MKKWTSKEDTQKVMDALMSMAKEKLDEIEFEIFEKLMYKITLPDDIDYPRIHITYN
jgi:hypothetical protein